MTENQQANQTEFAIQRIYVKDLSFESPIAPDVFRAEWKPEVRFELNTSHNKLDEKNFEVILHVTVTASLNNKTAFVVDVKQAGIFSIHGVEADQCDAILGSFCPSILFPYLREVVSDAVSRGSFPPLYLAPINFDAVYAEQKKQKDEKVSH